MPSRRSRSRSHSRSRSRSRSRSPTRNHRRHRDRRSASPERRRRADLPKGTNPIAESDYFQKSDEFRLWLKEEKRKYFDELSGDKARSYFRKFVKAWNRGKLSPKYYEGITPGSLPATTNTSYKWSFTSKRSEAEDDALCAARVEVGAATHRDAQGSSTKSGGGSGRIQGPTLPTSSDMTYTHEVLSSQLAEEKAYRRAKNNQETKERIEEMVGPKPVGREGMLEKKAVRRESDRAFREKGDEGLEVDEGTLMGGGDNFQTMIARRELAKKRHEHKQEEKVSAIRERTSAMREREKATMDMFQQLAKQRFG